MTPESKCMITVRLSHPHKALVMYLVGTENKKTTSSKMFIIAISSFVSNFPFRQFLSSFSQVPRSVIQIAAQQARQHLML